MNAEQRAAVEARGEVFVSAGAGTGKTTVLVERFVRAVCDEGLDVDSVLVITYTRKAAGELRSRIRAALVERGRSDLARELDGAWISTIHGFCARLLRAHPFAVGIDPGFHELDDEHGAVLRGEAFSRALEDFCARGGDDRTALLAVYGSVRLRKMLTGVYETLRSAGRPLTLELGAPADVGERLDTLRDAARGLIDDPGATERHLASARGALDLPSLPETLIDLANLRAHGPRAAGFEEARKAVEQAALEHVATRDRDLLQELLDLFQAEYRAAKERESALDFEDLQLLARELLSSDARVREAEQLRFRAIMVDEFQDTNALQCDLVDLLTGGSNAAPKEVFYVGDEFQSIYAFRHADVDVFRERRASAAQRLTLSENYRSRPEVLAAVNHVFGEEFGDGYQPLAASGEFPDPVFGHPVELLVTDKESYRDSGLHWRRAEARHVARRVRELVDTGAATPGEIVLLFAAGTDAEWYEEELRAERLPTYRATGRRYFGQQQVVDLLMYLRLLRNRYDDEALAAVLASPMVGVSNDALVLVRRHAGRRPLFTGIERSLPESFSAEDVRLVRAFRQRYDRLVAASARVSLERLCELVVSGHDYDLAVLARWDGPRRYANLRKLMRLARTYEEVRGRDLEGFLVFLRDQEALGAAQLEAVSEEEGADAVRLLTIHAAKGLEFKVVVVADAGRDLGGAAPADEIVALADGRLGFKVVHPDSGERKAVFGYDEVAGAGREAARAERLRLYYVAMTRAIDRLLVSGALGESRDTPIGWVLSKLDCEAELAGPADVLELERGGASFLVRRDRFVEEPAGEPEPLPEIGSQLSLFDELPASPRVRGWELPELASIPSPPLAQGATALLLGARPLRAVLLPFLRRASRRAPGAASRAPGRGPRGHRGRRRRPPCARARRPPRPEAARRLGGAVVVPAGHRRGARADPSLRRVVLRLAARRPPRRAPRGCGSSGRLRSPMTASCCTGASTSSTVTARGRSSSTTRRTFSGIAPPAEVIESDYRLQRLVYALACFRGGADEVEVVYAFLESPGSVVSTSFLRPDLPALEAELSAAIARIDAGEFVPTPSEFTCSGCPALDLVCSGPSGRRPPGDDAGP